MQGVWRAIMEKRSLPMLCLALTALLCALPVAYGQQTIYEFLPTGSGNIQRAAEWAAKLMTYET